MDTLNRYCLILFLLVFALPVAAQNQRMSSLFISNAFTNNGPSRLVGGVSTLAGLTNSGAPFTNSQPTYLGSHLTTYFGRTNWYSLQAGAPYTNREPYWDGQLIGSDVWPTLFDGNGHDILALRSEGGAAGNIMYFGNQVIQPSQFSPWTAVDFKIRGTDDGNATPRFYRNFTAQGGQQAGDILQQFDASNVYAEAYTGDTFGGMLIWAVTNGPILRLGNTMYPVHIQGAPIELKGGIVKVDAANWVAFHGVISEEGFTNYLAFRQLGISSFDGAMSTVDVNVGGILTITNNMQFVSTNMIPSGNSTNFAGNYNNGWCTYLMTNSFRLTGMVEVAAANLNRPWMVKMRNYSGGALRVSVDAGFRRSGTNDVSVPDSRNADIVVTPDGTGGLNPTNHTVQIILYDSP